MLGGGSTGSMHPHLSNADCAGPRPVYALLPGIGVRSLLNWPLLTATAALVGATGSAFGAASCLGWSDSPRALGWVVIECSATASNASRGRCCVGCCWACRVCGCDWSCGGCCSARCSCPCKRGGADRGAEAKDADANAETGEGAGRSGRVAVLSEANAVADVSGRAERRGLPANENTRH